VDGELRLQPLDRGRRPVDVVLQQPDLLRDRRDLLREGTLAGPRLRDPLVQRRDPLVDRALAVVRVCPRRAVEP
jgi:hypothetical protein